MQVDDVDAVALGEDETLHLRVPATGLVSEVNAALEELASGDDGHDRVLPHQGTPWVCQTVVRRRGIASPPDASPLARLPWQDRGRPVSMTSMHAKSARKRPDCVSSV